MPKNGTRLWETDARRDIWVYSSHLLVDFPINIDVGLPSTRYEHVGED